MKSSERARAHECKPFKSNNLGHMFFSDVFCLDINLNDQKTRKPEVAHVATMGTELKPLAVRERRMAFSWPKMPCERRVVGRNCSMAVFPDRYHYCTVVGICWNYLVNTGQYDIWNS